MNLPLHPLLVHFPIVLAAALPLVLMAILWVRHHHPASFESWYLAVMLALLLAVSATVASSTGEEEEDRVESFVPESAMELHEDRADVFVWLAWAVAGIVAAGLLSGAAGRVARYAAAGASVLLLVAAVGVGHAGAELVYRHGAAQAYQGADALRTPAVMHGEDDDDDD